MGVYIEGLDRPRNEYMRIHIDFDGEVWVFRESGWKSLGIKATDLDLVRCGECKYYNGHEEYCEIDHFARENGYCSDGKRRTDYIVFSVNPPKGIETPLRGDATVSYKNSKMTQMKGE